MEALKDAQMKAKIPVHMNIKRLNKIPPENDIKPVGENSENMHVVGNLVGNVVGNIDVVDILGNINNNFQNPPAKLSPKSERRNQRAMRRREREATLNHRNSTESLSDDPSQNRRYPHRETPNSNLATPNRDSNLTPNREGNSLNKSPNSPNLPNYRVVYLKCRILGRKTCF